MRRLLTGLVLGVAALLLVPTSAAHAHTSLIEGSPGPGAEVAPGVEVVGLEFGEVQPDGPHTIALLDEDDNPLAISEAVATDAKHVCARVEPMAVGIHAIEYSVVADDGHEVRGRYLFEVLEGGGAPTDLGCDAADLPELAAGESLGLEVDDVPSWVPWVLAPAVLLSVGLGVVAIMRNRRLADDSDDSDDRDDSDGDAADEGEPGRNG